MSFKSDLWAWMCANPAIAAKVGDRIYPGFAPSSAARPFIIYSRTSDEPIHRLGTRSVDGDTIVRDVVQFEIYAKTETEANDIKAVLEAEFNGAELTMLSTKVRRVFQSSQSDGMAMPDDGTNDAFYLETMEFTFWYVTVTVTGTAFQLEDGPYLLLEA